MTEGARRRTETDDETRVTDTRSVDVEDDRDRTADEDPVTRAQQHAGNQAVQQAVESGGASTVTSTGGTRPPTESAAGGTTGGATDDGSSRVGGGSDGSSGDWRQSRDGMGPTNDRGGQSPDVPGLPGPLAGLAPVAEEAERRRNREEADEEMGEGLRGLDDAIEREERAALDEEIGSGLRGLDRAEQAEEDRVKGEAEAAKREAESAEGAAQAATSAAEAEASVATAESAVQRANLKAQSLESMARGDPAESESVRAAQGAREEAKAARDHARGIATALATAEQRKAGALAARDRAENYHADVLTKPSGPVEAETIARQAEAEAETAREMADRVQQAVAGTGGTALDQEARAASQRAEQAAEWARDAADEISRAATAKAEAERALAQAETHVDEMWNAKTKDEAKKAADGTASSAETVKLRADEVARLLVGSGAQHIHEEASSIREDAERYAQIATRVKEEVDDLGAAAKQAAQQRQHKADVRDKYDTNKLWKAELRRYLVFPFLSKQVRDRYRSEIDEMGEVRKATKGAERGAKTKAREKKESGKVPEAVGEGAEQFVVNFENTENAYRDLLRRLNEFAAEGTRTSSIEVKFGLSAGGTVGGGNAGLKGTAGLKYKAAWTRNDDQKIRVSHSFTGYGRFDALVQSINNNQVGVELGETYTRVFAHEDQWAAQVANKVASFSDLYQQAGTVLSDRDDDERKLLDTVGGRKDLAEIEATSVFETSGKLGGESTVLGSGASLQGETSWLHAKKGGKTKNAFKVSGQAQFKIAGLGDGGVKVSYVRGHPNPDNDGLSVSVTLSISGVVKEIKKLVEFVQSSASETAEVDKLKAIWEAVKSGTMDIEKAKSAGIALTNHISSSIKERLADGLSSSLGEGGSKALGKFVQSTASSASLSEQKTTWEFNFSKETAGLVLENKRELDVTGSGFSINPMAETPLGVAFGVDTGYGHVKEKVKWEELGDNQLSYVKTVFDGLRAREDIERKKRVGEEKINEWESFAGRHRGEMEKLFANFAMQKGPFSDAMDALGSAPDSQDPDEVDAWNTASGKLRALIRACNDHRDELSDRLQEGGRDALSEGAWKRLYEQFTAFLDALRELDKKRTAKQWNG